jgi:hypothetical protein
MKLYRSQLYFFGGIFLACGRMLPGAALDPPLGPPLAASVSGTASTVVPSAGAHDHGPLTTASASAGDSTAPDDDDDIIGSQRSLNIEEPWQETSAYLSFNFDNNAAPGHEVEFGLENVIALNKDWGGEIDFPGLLLQQPVGRGQSSLGPIGFGLKYVLGRSGTAKSGMGWVGSLELFGQAWPTPNQAFLDTGSSVQLEAMEAFRLGRWVLEGQYGYTQALVQSQALDGWSANTSLGYVGLGHWFPQVEVDFNSQASLQDGSLGPQWLMIPELGFQAGKYFVELGLQLTAAQPGSQTLLLIEREY